MNSGTGPSNEHVWALGLSCETSAASGPPGLHTTARELQTRTFEFPGASNTTKIPREDSQRETKRAKMGAGEKKRAKFWAPHPSLSHPSGSHPSCPALRGPALRGSALRGSIFSRFAWAPPFGAPTMTHTRSKNELAKNWIGQNRSLP